MRRAVAYSRVAFAANDPSGHPEIMRVADAHSIAFFSKRFAATL